MFKKLFGVLQRVGKALMLPVAILPAAGLLLGIGNMLVNPDFLQFGTALDTPWVDLVATIMMNAGQIVFDNLALLFAVGVAVGLAGGEGVAGLAAIIGYLVMNVTLGTAVGVTPAMSGSTGLCQRTWNSNIKYRGIRRYNHWVSRPRLCTIDFSKSNCRPIWVLCRETICTDYRHP